MKSFDEVVAIAKSEPYREYAETFSTPVSRWETGVEQGVAVMLQVARKEIDRLNKACNHRAAHEYKLMGDVGMLVAINSELLAGLESMLDEHQALTSSAFKLHGEIRALIAKARGDL